MALLLPEEEDHWIELLQLIRGGLVIPVVGSELLRIADDPPEYLYERLARDLAAELRLPEPHPTSLNEVACRYLQSRRVVNLSIVYATLRKLLETRDYPIPDPLLKLAAITPLTLFLTTTFDSSLEKAIDKVRFGGSEKTRPVAFSLEYGGDLPEDVDGPPIVFHLFGTPVPFNKYAVTDEDVLEYIHSLQSSKHAPERLFDVVADRHLLIIGSSFTDWLARFFIRSAKRERIWMAKGREDFLADDLSLRDQSFAMFLQHFSAGMKVFSMPPVDFVDELHRRWLAEQPPGGGQTLLSVEPGQTGVSVLQVDDEPAELKKMAPGSIFLSYASEDRDAADAICGQLHKVKLDVWLDHQKLQNGQKWERAIRRNIDDASMVIVLVSRSSLKPGYRFFRVEWKLALKRLEGMPDEPPFILVYSIDGTRVTDHTELEMLEDLQYEVAAGGTLSEKQIQRILECFVQHETLREAPQ